MYFKIKISCSCGCKYELNDSTTSVEIVCPNCQSTFNPADGEKLLTVLKTIHSLPESYSRPTSELGVEFITSPWEAATKNQQ